MCLDPCLEVMWAPKSVSCVPCESSPGAPKAGISEREEGWVRNPGVSPSLSGSGSDSGGGPSEEAPHCLRGGPGFVKFLKGVAGGSSFEQGLLSWGAAGPHRFVCSRQVRDPMQGLCGQLLLRAERRVMAVSRSPGVKKKIQIISHKVKSDELQPAWLSLAEFSELWGPPSASSTHCRVRLVPWTSRQRRRPLLVPS